MPDCNQIIITMCANFGLYKLTRKCGLCTNSDSCKRRASISSTVVSLLFMLVCLSRHSLSLQKARIGCFDPKIIRQHPAASKFKEKRGLIPVDCLVWGHAITWKLLSILRMANNACLKHAVKGCDGARISLGLAHCFQCPAGQDVLLCPQSRKIASVHPSPFAHHFNTMERIDSTSGLSSGLCSSPFSWDVWWRDHCPPLAFFQTILQEDNVKDLETWC